MLLHSSQYYLRVLKSNVFLVFFFNDTATTEIYTLSLHDALPIYRAARRARLFAGREDLKQITTQSELEGSLTPTERAMIQDRKSTRLNSSHDQISYAVFCLKNKK